MKSWPRVEQQFRHPEAARAVRRDDATIVLGLATAGLALFVGAGLMRMARVGGSEWGTRWFST